MAEGKKIFISYSSTDIEFVDRITGIISEMGLQYWKAPEMIPAGSSYAREIPKAIQECDACLFVVSEHSQESIWVEKEIDSIINRKKHILPVKIDDRPLNDMYRFYLNNVQMLIYDGDMKRLEHSIWKNLKSAFIGEKTSYEEVLHRDEEDEKLKEQIRKNNIFTPNKAPVECNFCMGAVKLVSKGVYRCIRCGRESYDYYETIRRFLRENGAANAMTIERNTNVPRKVIDFFLKEEYLEIPKFDKARILCSGCGKPIRLGTLCDICKKRRK